MPSPLEELDLRIGQLNRDIPIIGEDASKSILDNFAGRGIHGGLADSEARKGSDDATRGLRNALDLLNLQRNQIANEQSEDEALQTDFLNEVVKSGGNPNPDFIRKFNVNTQIKNYKQSGSKINQDLLRRALDTLELAKMGNSGNMDVLKQSDSSNSLGVLFAEQQGSNRLFKIKSDSTGLATRSFSDIEGLVNFITQNPDLKNRLSVSGIDPTRSLSSTELKQLNKRLGVNLSRISEIQGRQVLGRKAPAGLIGGLDKLGVNRNFGGQSKLDKQVSRLRKASSIKSLVDSLGR